MQIQLDESDESFVRKIILEELKNVFDEATLRKIIYEEVKRGLMEAAKPKAVDVEDYLTIDDVAKMLCVKRDTVKKMNVERKIPFDKPNKFPRYRRSDVLAYMKKIHVKSMDEIEKDAEEYIRANLRR